MRINSFLICFIISIVVFSGNSFAIKPSLILLPIQGPELNRFEQDNYRIALQQSLSKSYNVFSGGEVEKRLLKVSAKTCSTSECLQEVAISFQGELIGRLVVTPVGDGYLLALEIKNIFDDKLITSLNIPCESCNQFAVIRALQELDLESIDSDEPSSLQLATSIGDMQTDVVKDSIPENDNPTPSPDLHAQDKVIQIEADEGGFPWWGWVLGVAVVAGLAGDSGSGSSDSTEGEITVTW